MTTKPFAAAAVAAALVCGCGGGEEPLHDVTGTVTYDGKAVPAGVVYLDPDAATGGRQGFANIRDGKFDTADKGRGVRGGGGYVIRVTGFDGRPVSEGPLGKPLWAPEYEFKKSIGKEKTELPIVVPKK